MCGEFCDCFSRWPDTETSCGCLATITETGYHHQTAQGNPLSSPTLRARVDFPYHNSIFQKRASVSLLLRRNSKSSVSLIKLPLQSEVDSVELMEQNSRLSSRYCQTYGEEDSGHFSGYPDIDLPSVTRSSIYSDSSGERSPHQENHWMTYREITPTSTIPSSSQYSSARMYQAFRRSISFNKQTFEKQTCDPPSVDLLTI